jgi:hypothetical protein
VGEMNTYKILVGKIERFVNPGRREEDSVMIDVMGIGCED